MLAKPLKARLQMFPGPAHADYDDTYQGRIIRHFVKKRPFGRLEQDKGVEPSSLAWEANALPMC